MSCDYSVWNPARQLTAKEAGELHVRLCEGDLAGLVPTPAVQAFYDELTALHPEIDDIREDQLEDKELCPWSVALDKSDGHIIMCCVWSKADYVGELVARLAAKHGLAFYDPQSEKVVYPGAEPPSKSWWKLW